MGWTLQEKRQRGANGRSGVPVQQDYEAGSVRGSNVPVHRELTVSRGRNRGWRADARGTPLTTSGSAADIRTFSQCSRRGRQEPAPLPGEERRGTWRVTSAADSARRPASERLLRRLPSTLESVR
jgi:hypothetical protein